MSAQLALKEWVAGRSLSFEAAESLMGDFFSGSVEDGLVGGLLVALNHKGVTGPELAGLASSMRAYSTRLGSVSENTIDTCGTGGGIPTFNMSTGAAIVAAAAGAKVAKHGNRGVTSSCGSADVLEASGVRLISDVHLLGQLLSRTGLCFMFAQHHHPAMRHVIGVRKALGVRTVFNLLGPLANPAGAKRQMIGLYDWDSSGAVAEALVLLGVDLAYVVHAREGLDEISPAGMTDVVEVRHGGIRRLTWGPADFGLSAVDPKAMSCGEDVAGNAAILREALSSVDSSRALAILPNAACALLLSGLVDSLEKGAELARETILNGLAIAKLREYASATHEVPA